MHGKGHDPQTSCIGFLFSVNAGQHTGLRRFLSPEASKGSNYRWRGITGGELSVCGTA